MTLDRLLDVGFGFLQGGFCVAIYADATYLALGLLALATTVGVIGIHRNGVES